MDKDLINDYRAVVLPVLQNVLIKKNFEGRGYSDALELEKDFNEILRLAEKALNSQWIPVSEGLPNRNGVYNVTRIIDGTAISDACYFDGQNTWHSDNRVNHGRPYLTDVIAWQPRPEPYKKEGAE